MKESNIKIDGWVLLDKNSGISSTSCTSRVKKMFSASKAGHAGTLDPLASGVLLIALGEATKTMSYVADGVKEYVFTMKFGVATDTYDRDGKIVEENNIYPTKEEVCAAAKKFIGDIKQKPPIFSALKVGGVRAYVFARLGKKIELEARKIHIYSLDFLGQTDDKHMSFCVKCSKGTYIRRLAVDIAMEVGAIAHLVYLRRVSVENFSDKNAVTLLDLDNLKNVKDAILPVDIVLQKIQRLDLSKNEYIEIINGRSIVNSLLYKDEIIRVYYKNVICALTKNNGSSLHPFKVFNILK